ncbi:DsbA family protein [Arthrobacter castelli]|uniref:DsbA family protein n=1 Tax=Arthrobacter castelli TaxID=271431 RepID=UPI00040C5BC3|nr:thioredoxin domain-containing protein [Arthrobacter castelli]
MTPQNKRKPTRAERTAEAREKARRIREEQQKREKRNRLLVRWGVVVAAVAIVAVIALIVAQNIRGQIPDEGPTAANTNEYGGVVVGKNGKVLTNDQPGQIAMSDLPDETPKPEGDQPLVPPGVEESQGDEPVRVVLYEDFQCPVCKQFEETFGPQLEKLRNSGEITVEYRTISILDRASTSNYSSRSANAAMCVADESPGSYAEYVDKLYAEQPPEGGDGLSDDRLAELASEVGAADISQCMDENTFRPAVKIKTERASMYGVGATPTAFVDGKKWNGQQNPQFMEFVQKQLDKK